MVGGFGVNPCSGILSPFPLSAPSPPPAEPATLPSRLTLAPICSKGETGLALEVTLAFGNAFCPNFSYLDSLAFLAGGMGGAVVGIVTGVEIGVGAEGADSTRGTIVVVFEGDEGAG